MRLSCTRALLVATSILIVGVAAPAQDVDKALAAFRAGEWKKAAEAANAIPKGSKDYLRAQYLAGETWLVLADAAKAETCFLEVLETKPEAVPAIVGFGRALTAEDKLDEAEQALERAVKLDAKDVGAKLAMGELHLRAKKFKEAKAELAEAYALDAKNPAVVRGYCEGLWSENDNAKAAQVAAALSKSQPKCAMGPFLEALAFERDGKDNKAIGAYEEALKRDPNFLDAHKNLAILCHTQNPMYSDADRTSKALEHYEKYFALGGKDPQLEQLYKQFKGFMDQQGGGKGR